MRAAFLNDRRRLGGLLGLVWLFACGDSEPGRPLDGGPAPSWPAPEADSAALPGPSDAGAALDAEIDPSEPPDAGGAPDAGDAALPVADPSAALYQLDAPLEVEITLAPEDWETLRGEGRTFSDVYTGCAVTPFDYTTFPASVRVDGQTFENVGVRKKGFLGSLSVVKPSLRIELDEYVDGQNLLGETIVTLNNSLQDRSFTHTCMAFAAFEAAGIPAPRCAFARVTVNGRYLGTYVHVEAVKKPFLARHFGNDEGDLYEGAVGDFRTTHLPFLEKKTNEDEPLSPEVEALTTALEKPDSELLAAVEPLVDLDSFMRYWATEALVAHGDSYSGNLNNFFIYVHPDTRKIHFMPWGTDGAYVKGNAIGKANGQPESVYARGRLSARLYALASTRETYRETLRKLLDEQWDEQALLAQVDRIGEIVGDEVLPDALETQRKFIRERRAELDAELDGEAPDWTLPEPLPIACHADLGSEVRGGFNTSLSLAAEPAPEIALENGLSIELTPPLSTVLTFATAGMHGQALAVALTMFQLDGGLAQLVLVNQRTDLNEVLPGEIAFHGFETFGVVFTGPSAEELTMRGFISDGTIRFDAYGPDLGDRVSGTFEGTFLPIFN